jgi:hypothetical protein
MMNTKWIYGLVACAVVSTGYAQTIVTPNQLSAAAPQTGTEAIAEDQGTCTGCTVRTSPAQLATYTLNNIPAGIIALSKLATQAALTLVGNPSGGYASPVAITLGTNLSFSGTTLNATGGGGSPANPTALVGPTTVNGVATTFMRSDAAPGLDTTQSYTFSGTETFNGSIAGTAIPTYLAAPPAIGGSIANAGSFTNFSYTGTFGGVANTIPLADLANINPGNVACNAGSSAASPAGCNTSSNRYSSTNSITIAASDNGGVIVETCTGAYTGTIAQAGTTGFPESSFSTTIRSRCPYGGVITPTTSTIDGGATFSIGPYESVWIAADGAGNYYTVRLGRPNPVILQSAVPFILSSSGSVGNNCAITGLTALPTTYASAYIWMPAAAIASGSAAGWYYFVASSATAGTCYNNVYNTATSGTPTIPASPTAFVTTGPGAFTQTTGSGIIGPTATVGANTMGVNGELQIDSEATFYNSGTNKDMWTSFNGQACYMFAGETTNQEQGNLMRIRNAGATNSQKCNTAGESAAGQGYSRYSVDTTAAQSLSIVLELHTATDWLVLESYSMKEYAN